jgi:hypothetical protein
VANKLSPAALVLLVLEEALSVPVLVAAAVSWAFLGCRMLLLPAWRHWHTLTQLSGGERCHAHTCLAC